VSVDTSSPEYIERAIAITQERISQIDQTMATAQRDLDDALIRADLDKIAPLADTAGATSSSTAVVQQHEERMNFLRNSRANAEERLAELKSGSPSPADPPPPPPTAKKS
jgi:uncharacterized membrane protein YccC